MMHLYAERHWQNSLKLSDILLKVCLLAVLCCAFAQALCVKRLRDPLVEICVARGHAHA
jgi:hypothetical protein